jgi:hypothetical protein
MDEDPKVLEIIRGMTAEQKLRAASQLYWTARTLTASHLRTVHPDWSEEQVQNEVRDVYLYSHT